jgi:hypothetical protein
MKSYKLVFLYRPFEVYAGSDEDDLCQLYDSYRIDLFNLSCNNHWL